MNVDVGFRVLMAPPILPLGTPILVLSCYRGSGNNMHIESFLFTTAKPEALAGRVRVNDWSGITEEVAGVNLEELLYSKERREAEENLQSLICDQAPEPLKQAYLIQPGFFKQVDHRELVRLWLSRKLSDEAAALLYQTRSPKLRSFVDSFNDMQRPVFTKEGFDK